MWLVCLNYLFAWEPGLSYTQVFYMVSVVWLIETRDRDGASGLDWHFTHCNNVTVNSWQNNSRHSTHSGAFRRIVYITISYRLFNHISMLHICYRSVLWHNCEFVTHYEWLILMARFIQCYQYSVNCKPDYHVCIAFWLRLSWLTHKSSKY